MFALAPYVLRIPFQTFQLFQTSKPIMAGHSHINLFYFFKKRDS